MMTMTGWSFEATILILLIWLVIERGWLITRRADDINRFSGDFHELLALYVEQVINILTMTAILLAVVYW